MAGVRSPLPALHSLAIACKDCCLPVQGLYLEANAPSVVLDFIREQAANTISFQGRDYFLEERSLTNTGDSYQEYCLRMRNAAGLLKNLVLMQVLIIKPLINESAIAQRVTALASLYLNVYLAPVE